MARPTTKIELIQVANEQFSKLWSLIDTMNFHEQNTQFNFSSTIGKEAHWKRDQNIRDVLIHLYEWHYLLLNWVSANTNGEDKPFLPEPYTWKTYGDMNVEFWKKHQNTPYETSIEIVKESHKKVLQLIETFSNDELFVKRFFKWTGTSSLGSYCVSATSSHYDWAMKKIKAHLKILK